MSDVNTPAPTNEQAAAILQVFDEAMAESTSRAHALAHVMEILVNYAEGFPVLTTDPAKIGSQQFAVTTARLGAIAAELRCLAREQSPPPAPTNEQAASVNSSTAIMHWLRDESDRAMEVGREEDGFRLLRASQLISGLIGKDAPEGAPVHRAPAPIPIPPEGIPDSAKSDDCCWLGYWMNGFKCWAWIFCPYEIVVAAISVGCTHYLPANTPPAP